MSNNVTNNVTDTSELIQQLETQRVELGLNTACYLQHMHLPFAEPVAFAETDTDFLILNDLLIERNAGRIARFTHAQSIGQVVPHPQYEGYWMIAPVDYPEGLTDEEIEILEISQGADQMGFRRHAALSLVCSQRYMETTGKPIYTMEDYLAYLDYCGNKPATEAAEKQEAKTAKKKPGRKGKSTSKAAKEKLDKARNTDAYDQWVTDCQARKDGIAELKQVLDNLREEKKEQMAAIDGLIANARKAWNEARAVPTPKRPKK